MYNNSYLHLYYFHCIGVLQERYYIYTFYNKNYDQSYHFSYYLRYQHHKQNFYLYFLLDFLYVKKVK